jgi:hypothetical protein
MPPSKVETDLEGENPRVDSGVHEKLVSVRIPRSPRLPSFELPSDLEEPSLEGTAPSPASILQRKGHALAFAVCVGIVLACLLGTALFLWLRPHPASASPSVRATPEGDV